MKDQYEEKSMLFFSYFSYMQILCTSLLLEFQLKDVFLKIDNCRIKFELNKMRLSSTCNTSCYNYAKFLANLFQYPTPNTCFD